MATNIDNIPVVKLTKAEIEEYCGEDGPVTVILTMPSKSSMKHVLNCAKNQYDALNFKYITECNQKQTYECKCDKTAKAVEKMTETQSEMQETLQAFINEVTKLKTDSQISTISTASTSSNSQKQLQTKTKCLPRITTVQGLDDFEKSLSNADVMKQAIEECNALWRKTTDTYGTLMYCLLDNIFPKWFIAAECSWGGGGKITKKIPFKFYHNIIELFVKSIQQVDKQFTRTLCEDFFKNNIFKNCIRRANTLGLRTTTQRISSKRRRAHAEKMDAGKGKHTEKIPRIGEEENSFDAADGESVFEKSDDDDKSNGQDCDNVRRSSHQADDNFCADVKDEIEYIVIKTESPIPCSTERGYEYSECSDGDSLY